MSCPERSGAGGQWLPPTADGPAPTDTKPAPGLRRSAVTVCGGRPLMVRARAYGGGPARPEPTSVTAVAGVTFCISGRAGDIRPGTEQGLFFQDTRFISGWQLMIDGQPTGAAGRAPAGTVCGAVHRAASARPRTRRQHGPGGPQPVCRQRNARANHDPQPVGRSGHGRDDAGGGGRFRPSFPGQGGPGASATAVASNRSRVRHQAGGTRPRWWHTASTSGARC